MDLALQYNPDIGAFDLAIEDGDLVADTGLQTAVILSVFTDRRAEPDDVLPDGSNDRRGYWADAYAQVPGDRWGSRAWLLAREKETAEVRQAAQEYDAEALQWLVDDGIAASIETEAEDGQRRSVLAHNVRITRPDGSVESPLYNYWEIL